MILDKIGNIIYNFDKLTTYTHYYYNLKFSTFIFGTAPR